MSALIFIRQNDNRIRLIECFHVFPLLEDKYLKTKEMHSLFALMSLTNMAAMTSHENTPLYRVAFNDDHRIQTGGMLFLMVKAKAPFT